MDFKIELNLDELNVVLAGLGKLPLEVSLGLFDKIKAQAQDQVKESGAQSSVE